MILSISYLDKYPSTTQTMLRSKIKDIVGETFVFPADYDYLNARWSIGDGGAVQKCSGTRRAKTESRGVYRYTLNG